MPPSPLQETAYGKEVFMPESVIRKKVQWEETCLLTYIR